MQRTFCHGLLRACYLDLPEGAESPMPAVTEAIAADLASERPEYDQWFWRDRGTLPRRGH